jgi:hypothetical protein
VTFETHLYEMDGKVIWGATARILASFIEAVRRISPERPG